MARKAKVEAPPVWDPAKDPIYQGSFCNGQPPTVTVNGERLKMRPNESRQEFPLHDVGWGARNQNAAITTWALLMDATGDAAIVEEVKAEFLRQVVRRWHRSGWLICRSAILNHVLRIREELAGRLPRSL